jgi:hypothetical protein
MLTRLSDRPWKRVLLFALIAALAYLPSALRLTYYRDDWYYAYDALVGPSGVFRLMFSSDRPARGPFFELYHALFGVAPLGYHLAMYAWRLVGGLATVWLFKLVWPGHGRASWLAGLVFTLYPGFTWWVSGIEYQPMVASAALMVVSLALTVQVFRLDRAVLRLVCMAAAIFTGWLYLLLVEYAAGIEIVRLCLIFMLVKAPAELAFFRRAGTMLRSWLPYLVIPVGFGVWRFVIFTSARRATNLGAQLGAFAGDPLSTGLHWLVSFLESFINVVFAAWVVPLSNNFFSGTLRQIVVGLFLAVFVMLLAWLLLREEGPAPAVGGWPRQAVILGAVAVVVGILPVIAANRQITFPNFSHYALPASLGVALGIAGLVNSLDRPGLRAALALTALALAVLTLGGIGTSALREERAISAFWQQVAWRAPSLTRGTTLLVYYPGIDYGDDTDIVWGPADFIYYRQPQAGLPVSASVSAITPDRNGIANLQVGLPPQVSTYRAHTVTLDYSAALVMVQSAEDSCVRVLDPRWPTASVNDDPALEILAAYSHPDQIAADPVAASLPVRIFGPEPRHTWCYFYEKAELASQQGDWAKVARLQNELGGLGLHANDQIEWMPFLQAQAYLGDLQAVRQIASRINTQKLYKQQACRNLSDMPENGYPLPPESQALIQDVFCAGGS